MNEIQVKLARQLFDEWFAENYPGPRTIINDPHWHEPKIFSAVLSCVREVEADAHAEKK